MMMMIDKHDNDAFAGVMGEGLDTDLVGVVVAAVCIAILCVVIIAFSAYCCFRYNWGDGDTLCIEQHITNALQV